MTHVHIGDNFPICALIYLFTRCVSASALSFFSNDTWSSSATSFTGIETTSPFVPAPELLIAGSGQPSSLFSAAAVTFLIILVNKSSENNE